MVLFTLAQNWGSRLSSGTTVLVLHSEYHGTAYGPVQISISELGNISYDGRVADGAEYDWGSLARYAVMGTAVFPPLMFNWYKWLDTRYILIKVI